MGKYANPEIKHSEIGEGNGVIFSPVEDYQLEFVAKFSKERGENGLYPSKRIIRTKNIATGEQTEALVKEKRIWGLDTLGPIAVTNLVAQGR